MAALGVHKTQALAFVIVCALGWCAHRFKRRSKYYYGLSEFSFGVASAIAAVSTVNFAAVEFSNVGLPQVLALLGSTYIVARGLNNCYDAKHPGLRLE